jgi:hypothetical protein
MIPGSGVQRTRKEDQLWFKAAERLGLPTVLCLGLFWAWDSSVTAERALAAKREDRLVAVISELRGSLDTLNHTLVGQSSKVGDLAIRVQRVEDLAQRAMGRRLAAAGEPRNAP